MSNRKKPKRSGILRRQAVRDAIASQERTFQGRAQIMEVAPPDEEKELLKTVPAKADGVIIGVAHMYDDGTVDIIIDEDADPEAVAKVRALEGRMTSFSLFTNKED